MKLGELPAESASEALAELEGLLGTGAVLVPGRDDIVRYEQDARSGRGVAAGVIRPSDVDGVRAAVRWAAGHGARLVPQGANSGLVGASIPDASATMMVLSLERLVQPLVIDPLDATARVGAGVRLSALNAIAAPHGLFFPIDLGADPTIGGMIATNTGGARLLRYGDVRHNLLAIRAVIGDTDATVVNAGRGLRKDNTGLDVKQLFVGTGGAFGVVIEAVLQLHRKPKIRAAAMVALADTSGALALLAHLSAAATEVLTAFELISANALRHTLAHTGLRAPFTETSPVTVLVELACADAGRDLDGELASLLADFDDLEVLDAAFGPAEQWWEIRHRINESLRAAGVLVAFDVAVPRSSLPALRAKALALVAERAPQAELCDFGHLGDGGVHLNVLFPSGVVASSGEALDELRRAMYDIVADLGGTFSAEHGLGPRNDEVARRHRDVTTEATVEALRQRFDPHGIFGGRAVV